jgi:hypothetical protein
MQRLRPVRSDLWRRVEKALQILAEGVALRVEVDYRLGIYGGASKRLFDTLIAEGFVEQFTLPMSRFTYAVVRLTKLGAEFTMREYGMAINPSEWDILVQKHNAEEHTNHAFSVLLFAYHARRRGWRVEVCPPVNHPLVEPDVLVEKGDERLYVEVEVLRHPRKRKDGADNTWVRKWINQYAFQKQVAVCTLTPKRMQGILRYLKPRFPGVATELSTLAKNPDSDLWLERWVLDKTRNVV